MDYIKRSGGGILARLAGMVGFVCATLLLPVPAWAQKQQAGSPLHGSASVRLNGLISQLSDSSVFDSLTHTNYQRVAEDQPQQALRKEQPQQALRKEQPQQALPKEQPQQALPKEQPQQARLRKD